MRLSQLMVGLSFLGLVHFNAHADSSLLRKYEVKHFVKYLVQHDHLSQTYVENALKEAQYQPQIIELMERPYEKKNWDIYRSFFLTPERVKEGVAFWKAHEKTLAHVEKQYGVPAEVIVSILGVETRYGKRQGDYKVIDALTTLAFYYPKRSPYFTRELREYLIMCQEHHKPVSAYYGSYAGAMGQPQFMPSNYREYAVDFKQKGHRDLIQNDEDSIASVANYFKAHGWKPGQVVTFPANLSGHGYEKLEMNARAPNYTVQALYKAGVKPYPVPKFSPSKAALLALPTAKGPEYWVAYPNFYAITRYNTSPQYALAVYLLSQDIKAQRNRA